jgi:hypothetical protein
MRLHKNLKRLTPQKFVEMRADQGAQVLGINDGQLLIFLPPRLDLFDVSKSFRSAHGAAHSV